MLNSIVKYASSTMNHNKLKKRHEELGHKIRLLGEQEVKAQEKPKKFISERLEISQYISNTLVPSLQIAQFELDESVIKESSQKVHTSRFLLASSYYSLVLTTFKKLLIRLKHKLLCIVKNWMLQNLLLMKLKSRMKLLGKKVFIIYV